MNSLDALEDCFINQLGFRTSREESNGQQWLGFGADGTRVFWATDRAGRLELSLDVEVGTEEGIDAIAQDITRRAYCVKALVIRRKRELSFRMITGSRPLDPANIDLEACAIAARSFVDEVGTFAPNLQPLQPVNAPTLLPRPVFGMTLPEWNTDEVAYFIEPMWGTAELVGSSLVFRSGGVTSQIVAVKSHEGQVENLLLHVARPMGVKTWSFDDTQRLNALNLGHPSVASFIAEDLSLFGCRIHIPRGVRDDLDAIETAVSQLTAFERDERVLEAFDVFGIERPTH